MAEPVDRKARLAALASRAGRTNSAKNDDETEKEDTKPVVSFRNYAPKDASLDAATDSSWNDEHNGPLSNYCENVWNMKPPKTTTNQRKI
eukprot:scaffold12435_cov51-Attheya_sp.AAC.4